MRSKSGFRALAMSVISAYNTLIYTFENMYICVM